MSSHDVDHFFSSLSMVWISSSVKYSLYLPLWSAVSQSVKILSHFLVDTETHILKICKKATDVNKLEMQLSS